MRHRRSRSWVRFVIGRPPHCLVLISYPAPIAPRLILDLPTTRICAHSGGDGGTGGGSNSKRCSSVTTQKPQGAAAPVLHLQPHIHPQGTSLAAPALPYIPRTPIPNCLWLSWLTSWGRPGGDAVPVLRLFKGFYKGVKPPFYLVFVATNEQRPLETTSNVSRAFRRRGFGSASKAAEDQ